MSTEIEKNLELSSDEQEILKKTLSLLELTYNEIDTNKRKDAENQLEELSKNINSHIKILFSSLLMDNLNLNMKKSVSIYLKNFIYKKIKDKNLVKEILKIVIYFILYKKNDKIVSKQLNLLLLDLLNKEDDEKLLLIDNDLFTSIIKNITQEFINIISNEKNYYFIQQLIYIFNSIYESKIIGKLNYIEITLNMINIIDKIFELLKEDLTKLENQTLSIFIALYELMYFFLNKGNNLELLNDILINVYEKYNRYTIEILLKINQNENSNSIFFFKHLNINTPNITNEINTINLVNDLKAKCFQFIAIIIQYSGKQIKNESMKLLSFELVKAIIINLEDFLLNHSNELNILDSKMNISYNNIDEEKINSLFFNMIVFLSRALIREPIKSEFSSLINKFILNNIIPFLLTNNNDINEIKEDGENYYNFLQDLTNDFKLKSYKTAVAFLIKKLCEEYSDLSNFILSFCIQLFDFILNNENSDSNNNLLNYPLINQYKNELLLFNKNLFDNEKLLDIIFIIFCLLYEKLLKNKNFVNNLKTIFNNNLEKLLTVNSIILLDKLCLFLGKYSIQFYSNNDNNFNDNNCISLIIKFLLENIIKYNNSYPGISFQSCNSFIELLLDDDFNKINNINEIFLLYFPKLIDIIKDSNVNLIFDVIDEIVNKISLNDNSEMQLNLLKNCAIRIQLEFTKNNNNNSDSLIIDKLFTIINHFIDKNDFKNFEEILSPIINYIKNPTKINFEDDILNIITKYMEKNNVILNLNPDILKVIPKIIEKEEEVNNNIYSFLLTIFKICKKNNNYSNYLEQYNDDFLEIIKKGIEFEIQTDEINDMNAFKICKIYFILNKNIPQEKILDLFNEIYNNLKYESLDNNNEEDKEEKEENLKLNFQYLSVLCCGGINYPKILFDLLINKNDDGKFLRLIQKVQNVNLYQVYDRKFIILCILNLIHLNLFKEQNEVIQILKLIFYCLYYQRKNEEKFLKKLMKDDLNCNFIEDEEDDDDDDEGLDENTLYKKLRNQLDDVEIEENNNNKNDLDFLDITKKDEFELFVEIINKLQLKDELENRLNSVEEKENFNNIFHTRRINVNYNNSVIYVPRRTVKIKRPAPPTPQ